ncbi:formyltransferase family protein [uncultured Duncaniella sp.]|uniref:formyltransferase family protein n=1 Tax=uncultured Duncaniella sp. TaxID=2768039 RepID=UPI0025CDDF65|nr:formyltransferase family protein [uncultured Duncaniella sp.]
MKKIAVLTYPVKHRKTYDVLSLLRANGYTDVNVYAIPFRYHKTKFPMIQHRPEMNFQIPEIYDLCSNLGYRYESGELESINIDEERIVLIAGVGILPKEFIDRHIIINSHPGYIPNCRGLDAFKWAIAEKQPIGVTTHLLGEEIDAGKIIERKIIDIYQTDTFHSAAQRVYENEVSMLIEAIEKIDNVYLETAYPENYKIHKRMPQEIEKNLFKMFEQYKNNYAQEIN